MLTRSQIMRLCNIENTGELAKGKINHKNVKLVALYLYYKRLKGHWHEKVCWISI
jgi:hypothetical protein